MSAFRFALALSAAAIFATPNAAKKTYAYPETMVCPKNMQDMDSGIYTMMRAAKFEQEGYRGYIRDVSKLGDMLSLDGFKYLYVKFVTFDRTDGTRLIAELRYVGERGMRDVDDEKTVKFFQGALDQFAAVFPCPS